MVQNIRDPKTLATAHPYYNMMNVVYRLYVQIFERIELGQYPPYVTEYMDAFGITPERIVEQQRLIADLLDGLMLKEYLRDESMSYLRKAMQDCRWQGRFDWQAMGVFDLLASQSMLAYFFGTFADLACDLDIEFQTPGELREIVDRLCRRATDHYYTSRIKMEEEKTEKNQPQTEPDRSP